MKAQFPYHPFGLKHKTYANIGLKMIEAINNETEKALVNVGLVENDVTATLYKYKYNGKEFQDELNLNLYDYGARNYDATIGRFFNLDRLSEKYEVISPYAYVANNPVRFIDVNGEWIYIKDGEQSYRYDNGELQAYNINGEWKKVDETTLSSETQNLFNALNKLSSSGDTGKGLLDFFSNDQNNVEFSQGDKNQHYLMGPGWGGFLDYNSSQDPNIETQNGNSPEHSPFYVIIGHELGHIESKIKGTYSGDIWYAKASLDEIWASHVENKIRAESGLPLRTNYFLPGAPEGRLLQADGTSLYIDKSESYPTLDNVKNTMYFNTGGEIIKERFNYENLKK